MKKALEAAFPYFETSYSNSVMRDRGIEIEKCSFCSAWRKLEMKMILLSLHALFIDVADTTVKQKKMECQYGKPFVM